MPGPPPDGSSSRAPCARSSTSPISRGPRGSIDASCWCSRTHFPLSLAEINARRFGCGVADRRQSEARVAQKLVDRTELLSALPTRVSFAERSRIARPPVRNQNRRRVGHTITKRDVNAPPQHMRGEESPVPVNVQDVFTSLGTLVFEGSRYRPALVGLTFAAG